MKKIIFICCIVAIISGIIGFLIGNNRTGNNLIGTYRTNSWNGKEAVLVLNSDNTFIHPNGNTGTWSIKGNKIYLEYESSYSYADGNIVTIIENKKEEATIVDKGIMINTHFFEKVT